MVSLLGLSLVSGAGCQSEKTKAGPDKPSKALRIVGNAGSAKPGPSSPSSRPASPAASAKVPGSAAPANSSAPAASSAIDPKNRAKPPKTSDELQARAKALFLAIQSDENDAAREFFFPKEPFLKLKAVKKPGKYWEQLYRTFRREIHKVHRRNRTNLKGAKFLRFELGSRPKWTKPGDEGNHIGYFRTYNGRIYYQSGDRELRMGVRVIISWQNRWYCTHLLPIRH